MAAPRAKQSHVQQDGKDTHQADVDPDYISRKNLSGKVEFKSGSDVDKYAPNRNVVLEPKPAEAPPHQSDVDLRNEFALTAFREIVAWQVATGKAGQEDVAASWAFRYGDRALAQSKKAPKGAPVMVRGYQEAITEALKDWPQAAPSMQGLPTEPVPPIAADAPGLPV